LVDIQLTAKQESAGASWLRRFAFSDHNIRKVGTGSETQLPFRHGRRLAAQAQSEKWEPVFG
jgi:hypothetical protein